MTRPHPQSPTEPVGPLPLDAHSVGPALRDLQAAGRLDLPLPGSGDTLGRWLALAELSALDLSLGRLAEAHCDAVAILAGLDGPPPDGLWAVWASEPPGDPLIARPARDQWVLHGRKAWCSGAQVVDHALVTARHGGERLLLAVDTCDLDIEAGTWPAVGMAATGSVTVSLASVRATAVGAPGAYLSRPGFWHGAAGVAACWYGGALGAARLLLQRCREHPAEPHRLAHLGAVDALVVAMHAHLVQAAADLDQDPAGANARLRAMRLRAHVEAAATEVLDRVGRALGAGPLCADAVHAQRAADLPVFLRQSHAERDLADLGALAAEQATW